MNSKQTIVFERLFPISAHQQRFESPKPSSPCCLALLKTLMSFSWTPMPVLRDTESVALSLLPLFMDPLAWVLFSNQKQLNAL